VVDVDTRGTSLKAMLRRANSLGAPLCLVLGDSEIDAGQVQVKDLAGHGQSTAARADVVADVIARLNGTGGTAA